MRDEFSEYEAEPMSDDYYTSTDYFSAQYRTYRALPEQNVRTDLPINVVVKFEGTTDTKVFEFMPAQSTLAKSRFVLLEDVEYEGLLYVEYYKTRGARVMKSNSLASFDARDSAMQPYAALYLKYSDRLPEKLKVKMLGFEEGSRKPTSLELEILVRK